ncbi:MAG: family 78 glycoside hydrolase catalytic domain [Clostridia bacterium]|nr:family 78 glycoside hydrolase catalytic domain [Clostridia bacterium]
MFKLAKPVFLKDLNKEMNITAFFAANFECNGKDVVLEITGATYYRITVNGEFAGYGPARAPKGFTRIDTMDITKHTSWGLNQIVVEVASYNCDNFACINVPGFLQAEVTAEGKPVAATGFNFIGFADVERVQKVMRYSYQRQFSEVYLRKGGSMLKLPVEEVEPKLSYMIRKAPFPKYDIVSPVDCAWKGELVPTEPNIPEKRFINPIGHKKNDGFKLEEIEYRPLYDMYGYEYKVTEQKSDLAFPYTLSKGQYAVLDFGQNVVGFIRHKVSVEKNARMILGFSERSLDGVFPILENNITNVVDYHMLDGEYEGETMEVYGFRYLYVFVTDGELCLDDVSVREYCYPLEEIPTLNTDDSVLQGIYKAAANTFRQNAVDVFVDCPTRERAGWLMDALFTARTEYFLTGKTTINEMMLNNYVVATDFDDLPEGMVPMCYPSAILNGEYIPQWSMWFVVQIYEQIERSGQKPEKYRKRVQDLVDFFAKRENGDGLLEKLENWNFVEWSKCNDWTQDINYPTNMLYYKFLNCVTALFPEMVPEGKAEALKAKIIEKSFNGKYFEENAVYENGVAKNTDNVSETCQYYAVWCGVADLNDAMYAELKETVLKVFGMNGTHDFVVPYEPSNAMNGIYLRMDILLQLGETELLLNETKDFFADMVEKSGTLWEHKDVSNSLNHGFASYVGVVLHKCLEK